MKHSAEYRLSRVKAVKELHQDMTLPRAWLPEILLTNCEKAPAHRGKGGEALVHRSPDVCYRPDQSVVTRLCLKVAADSFNEPEFGLLSRACTAEHEVLRQVAANFQRSCTHGDVRSTWGTCDEEGGEEARLCCGLGKGRQ